MRKKIFVLKGIKDEPEWRKLHNEEFHRLFSSQNFVSIINSKGWAVQRVSQEREGREFCTVLWEKPV
jgi:hypothetical protein